jgi:hypothetical protein
VDAVIAAGTLAVGGGLGDSLPLSLLLPVLLWQSARQLRSPTRWETMTVTAPSP